MARPTEMKRKVEASQFVKHFIANGGNAQDAVLAVTPMKKKSAIKRGQNLMARPDIKAMIIEAINTEKIDFKFVMGARKTIVDKGMERIDTIKITASDIHNQLSGIEKILLSLDEKRQTSNSNQFFFGNTNYVQSSETHEGKLTPLQDVLDGEPIDPLE